jgi:hypothetical protein
MSPRNHDLIQFFAFNEMKTQIVRETVLNIQKETIPIQFNNQQLDTFFFLNDTTVININKW